MRTVHERLRPALLASSMLDIDHGSPHRVLLGRHPRMEAVFSSLRQVAPTSVPVLICGESGTGKELVARAIHGLGPRRDERFVGLNCAAVPDTLLEAELFGVAKGAFTGADADRKGLFEVASGGTMLLDELGSMSPALQGKLLRVLQEKELSPVGATRSIAVDVRIIAATNADLEREVAAGRFRQDLYYRLDVVRIDLPPLRARLDDIPILAEYFVLRMAHEYGVRPKPIGPGVLEMLAKHSWPGNVRELENVICRALVCSRGEEITTADIRFPVGGATTPAHSTARAELPYHEARNRALLEFQKEYCRSLLRAHAGNISRSARAAGITRAALRRILARIAAAERRRPGAEE